MLLTADWLLPISAPPVADGAVLVSEGRIAAVGSADELRARYPQVQTHEYPGCALLPGLINAHTHLDYSAFKGFAAPSGFSRWMGRFLRARVRLDSEDLAASATWGAYECLRNGVTSIADTSYEGTTVARAARAAGLRARVYLEVFGLDDGKLESTVSGLRDGLRRVREASGSSGEAGAGALGGGPSVEWGVSPHAPYTVSQALYREVARMARGEGLHVATHVGESVAEARLLAGRLSALALVYRLAHLRVKHHWRPPMVSSVRYVADADALGPETLVVHAVQSSAEDIALLAQSGVAVAHCPRSNLFLHCGVAPIAEMRSAGVTVGLGTDSLASNDSLDMLAEMRAAVSVSRTLRAGLSAADVLRMATLDGARALGWGALMGSLEQGKLADVVAVSLPRGEVAHVEESLAETVMAGEVLMTMVGGRVAYEGEDPPSAAVKDMEAVRAKLSVSDRRSKSIHSYSHGP